MALPRLEQLLSPRDLQTIIGALLEQAERYRLAARREGASTIGTEHQLAARYRMELAQRLEKHLGRQLEHAR